MSNFKTIFFCNVGISSQSTIKNANQDPHNAVQINARNVDNVFTRVSRLYFSSQPFPSTAQYFPSRQLVIFLLQGNMGKGVEKQP